ncbi:MAG: hypothetical protein E7048_09320 [Lentisphaerae bacterium]|nr:hypothetical protein [Lentisphaerota bacterium]
MKHIAAQYFLNTDLRKEELEEQGEMLCDTGYEEIYLHARAGMKTPYLSKQWFEALQTVTEVLKKHNVRFSIWDEDNFPSGTAGNRIVNNYPELAAQRLNFLVFDAPEGEKLREFFSGSGAFLKAFAVSSQGEITDISEYCGTLRSKWTSPRTNLSAYSPYGQLPLPHRRRSMDTTRMAIEYTPAVDCRIVVVEILRDALRHNTDLLNSETVDRLVEYTHEEYKRIWGAENLKKECLSSFLDEPAPEGCFPWTRRFPEEFRKDHNYDLPPLLPHIFLDLTSESARIRNDYRTTLHRLLCQNYLGHLKKYLNTNGLLSVGHLSRSEYLSCSNTRWPNELRCLQYLDIPCGDPLGGGVGRMGSMAHHLGLKTVAAAARFAGKPAGADAFAVGGDSISLRDLKFMADYHLVMGITYFNIHGLNYTIEGESFDETPPSLFYQHSQWQHMKEFISYLKKRCQLLSAPHICTTGFLYPDVTLKCLAQDAPVPDELFHQTAEELLSHQRDFEPIDSITLAEQSPEDYARLRPFFIVANNDRIVRSTAEFLERYVEAGGRLIVTGCIPQIVDLPGVPVWNFAERYYTGDIVSSIPGPELKGEGSEAVLIRQFETADGTDTFIFNRSDLPFEGSFEGKKLLLEPGESKLASELATCSPAQILPLPEIWTLRFEGLNSVPLTFWNYRSGMIELFSLARQEEHPLAEAKEFHSNFLVSSGFRVFLTVEENMLKKGAFSVNGVPVTGFAKTRFRDCRDLECDITGHLNTGRSPLLNKITFTGTPLFGSPPYLRGVFSARVPPGGENYPILTAAPGEYTFKDKADFRGFGYGTYSGPARCTAKAEVVQKEKYTIRFAAINDSACLFIDGEDQGIRIAPPYVWEVELSQGEHTIELEICNNSGNRDRNLGLPAGMQI